MFAVGNWYTRGNVSFIVFTIARPKADPSPARAVMMFATRTPSASSFEAASSMNSRVVRWKGTLSARKASSTITS